MIEGSCGIYTLQCDICGAEANDDFFDFHDAVQHKKDEGWKSRKGKHGWEDVCPECQDEEAGLE
jgi:rRNA maturation protein Nop10